MIENLNSETLLESKFYTKLKLGLIRYHNKFNDLKYDKNLTSQLEDLLKSIKTIHMSNDFKKSLIDLRDKGFVKVYKMPYQQFIFLRRDMIWTYYDHYNFALEAGNSVEDTVCRVDRASNEFQIIVPDTTTVLANRKISRIITRQFHHEMAHFVYPKVKDDYFVKNRLINRFYHDVFFKGDIFPGGEAPENVLNRWLYVIKKFTFLSDKLNKIDSDSASLYDIRKFQNRTEILLQSFEGFIGDPLDVSYNDFIESLLRKIIPIDEATINIVSDSIRNIYKDHWKGSFDGARFHHKNKFYQELILPEEIFARMVEGAGRNQSNKIYRDVTLGGMSQF